MLQTAVILHDAANIDSIRRKTMILTSFIHQTPSAALLVQVKIKLVPSKELVPYENKQYISKLCTACPTYGKKWSCPPHSPALSDLDLSAYPHAALVLFWCELDQYDHAKTDYIKVKAANSVLKSRMDRFMRKMEDCLGGVLLSNGTCKLCRPCSGLAGQPCKRPEKMRFSMEALGLDVSRITEKEFEHPLLWYSSGKSPVYLSAVACLLMSDLIDESALEPMAKIWLSQSQS